MRSWTATSTAGSRGLDRLDTQTRTMQAEVDVANPSGMLLPGMYAEVSLERSDRACPGAD